MHVTFFYAYLALALAAAWILVQKTRRALLGPLRKIPGPRLNRWTNLPLKLAIIKGSRVHYIHALHQKYGAFVRITPDEVSISDPHATREIHKIGSGFNKTEWYAQFVEEGEVRNIFTMTNPKAHAQRRRNYSRAFSQQGLQDWEGFIQSRVRLAVEGIKKQATTNGKANILEWWSFMTTDVVSELVFGKSLGCLELEKKSVYNEDLEMSLKFSGIRVELSPLTHILNYIPLRSLQHAKGAAARVQEFASAAMQKSQSQETREHTFFYKVLADKESGVGLTDLEMERDAKAFIVAGSDTTAVTMTYLVWAVLKDPAVKKELQEEVDALRPGFSSQDSQNLRYLHMVIQEALRLYGAAPGSLPRAVPIGGKTLGGYFFPEGITVSTQAYTLHRDGTIFADPLRFDPRRWENSTQAMKDAFLPWGGGSRVCVGMHLANMELALAAATFFRECPTARIASTTTDEDMEIVNRFLIAPKHGKCEISLT